MDEKKFLALAFIIIIVGALFGWWWFFWPSEVKKVSASGTIESTEVEVSSKVPGIVVKLNISEGDKVDKNDILVLIDSSEFYALYKQAKAVLDLAEKNYTRVEKLSKDGFVSEQNFDQAKAAYDQAKAATELAGLRLKDATIRSPISGYCIVKSVEVGELVNQGSPIATIADLSKVYIIVYVLEEQVGKINLGDTAYVNIDSYPRDRFEGKVTYISKQAEFTPKTIQTRKERVTQVFAIKIEVNNPDLKLKPGLPADAVIKIN